MRDVLLDMGNTCIQGDTHRLFWSIIAVSRSLVSKTD
jgi:hypothetical protein